MAKKVPLRNLVRTTSRISLTENIGDLELMKLTVSNNKAPLRRALNDIGFNFTYKDLSEKMDKITARAMNSLSKLAMEALRSKVPVDKEYLRNTHTKITSRLFRTADSSNEVRTIYIEGVLHKSSGKRGVYASSLAQYKDEYAERRSRVSKAIPPFSPVGGTSRDWIKKAIKEFKGHREDAIKRALA